MTLRVLIVDDEAPARAKLRTLLADEPDVEIAAEASDGARAVQAILATHLDLVLLDIQMPGLDGFGVVEQVGLARMPPVVFVTAYDEHALKAFEVSALDYLLKPFAPSRLHRALDRVRDRQRSQAPGELARQLESVLDHVRRYASRLLVPSGDGREVLIDVAEIRVVRAARNEVRLLTADGEYRLRSTLTDLEQRLDPDQFLRINRSEIVRLETVREVQQWFRGDAPPDPRRRHRPDLEPPLPQPAKTATGAVTSGSELQAPQTCAQLLERARAAGAQHVVAGTSHPLWQTRPVCAMTATIPATVA